MIASETRIIAGTYAGRSAYAMWISNNDYQRPFTPDQLELIEGKWQQGTHVKIRVKEAVARAAWTKRQKLGGGQWS